MHRRAPLTWLENRFLLRHLRGRGIEIGALWKRFPVPRDSRVWYVDRLSLTDMEAHYPELHNRMLPPDIVADATELPVAPASLDFLIASHVIEHLPFPLKALRSWHDAIRPGGALLLKVPDKRYTFDARRPRTTLAHLIGEHVKPESADQRSHYAEWVANGGEHASGTPAFEQAVDDLMRQNYGIHFHVWIDEDIREIVRFTRDVWRLDWEPAVFWDARVYRKETTVVLRRSI